MLGPVCWPKRYNDPLSCLSFSALGCRVRKLIHTRDMLGTTVGSIQDSKCSLPGNFIGTSVWRGQGRIRKGWRSKMQVEVCSASWCMAWWESRAMAQQ